MERKDFIKNGLGFLGLAVAAPSLIKVGESNQDNANVAACTVTNSETEGPFPTITPTNFVRTNIVGSRTGVAFTINITINNINANCAALQGALVDIWHCDKDGYYSQYGGTSMQTVNYTSETFLRGRQVTDANGLVSFTSIFPGWYQSRATHIHVHIYNSAGTSLLITQIAFPEGTNSAVVLVNAATAYGYTKGMTGYTYNATDNVFSDGVTNEMSTVSGSVSGGFTLNHTIYVAGGTAGTNDVAEKHFDLGQNFPNPVRDITQVPLNLKAASTVSVQLFDLMGRLVSEPIKNQSFDSGENMISISKGNLDGGIYIYKVKVVNDNGTFEQSKKLIID